MYGGIKDASEGDGGGVNRGWSGERLGGFVLWRQKGEAGRFLAAPPALTKTQVKVSPPPPFMWRAGKRPVLLPELCDLIAGNCPKQHLIGHNQHAVSSRLSGVLRGKAANVSPGKVFIANWMS